MGAIRGSAQFWNKFGENCRLIKNSNFDTIMVKNVAKIKNRWSEYTVNQYYPYFVFSSLFWGVTKKMTNWIYPTYYDGGK